jgi:GGDEF domain-containing protein
VYFLCLKVNPSNPAFYGIESNPYFSLAIIFSAYYGLGLGVLTALLTSFFYLAVLYFSLELAHFEFLFEVKFMKFPILLIITCPLVGEIASYYLRKIESSEKQKTDFLKLKGKLEGDIDKITKQNNELKVRVTGKLDTTNLIYKSSKVLNTNDRELLGAGYMSIVKDILQCSDIAIYTRAKNGTFQLFLSEKKSVNHFPELLDPNKANSDELVELVFKQRKLVTIKDLTYDQQTEEQGIKIVAPIQSGEEILGVAVIGGIPFLKYIPSNFKIIDIYSKWYGESLDKITDYEEIQEKSIINERYGIFKYKYFMDRLEEEFEEAKRYNLSVSIFRVSMDVSNLNPGQQEAVKKLVVEVCKKSTRRMDCVADSNRDYEFHLLTPKCDHDTSLIVKKRIIRELNKFKGEGRLNFDIDIKVSSFDKSYGSAKIMYEKAA